MKLGRRAGLLGFILLAMLLLALPAAAQDDGGGLTVVAGTVSFNENLDMVVDGYIIAPANGFRPPTVSEGDSVIVTGTLLDDGVTIQAISLEITDTASVEELDAALTTDDDDGDESSGSGNNAANNSQGQGNGRGRGGGDDDGDESSGSGSGNGRGNNAANNSQGRGQGGTMMVTSPAAVARVKAGVAAITLPIMRRVVAMNPAAVAMVAAITLPITPMLMLMGNMDGKVTSARTPASATRL